MRRPRLPSFRRRGRDEAAAPTEPVREAPSGGGPTQPPDAGRPVDPHERIDGLRAWIAQVERRLALRTYVLGAGIVLALAAAAVAIALAVSVERDAATEDDLAALQREVTAVRQSATEEAQQTVESLTGRVDELEADFDALAADQKTTDRELQVVEDDIRDLQDQVAGLEASGRAGTDTSP